MDDNQRGLYSKYHVTKDGKPLDGDCFVLRPDRDPAAVAALRAYAAATDNNALARDIIGWIGAPEPLTSEQLLELDGEPVWCDHHQWALVEVLDYTPYLRYSGGTKQRACELFAIDCRIYAHKPGREVLS